MGSAGDIHSGHISSTHSCSAGSVVAVQISFFIHILLQNLPFHQNDTESSMPMRFPV